MVRGERFRRGGWFGSGIHFRIPGSNGMFENVDPGGVIDLDLEAVFFDMRDDATDPAGGDNGVSRFKFAEHLGMFPLLFSLRLDQKKPESHHKEDEREQLHEDISLRGLALGEKEEVSLHAGVFELLKKGHCGAVW